MIDAPFGRQPKPVKFTLEGEDEDIDYWIKLLKNRCTNHGDDLQMKHRNIFTIYPRAVND